VDLIAECGLAQSTASAHLACLRKCKLVECRPVGAGLRDHLSHSVARPGDNVVEARVVCADGGCTVSAESHLDLYWAIRGRGGNFGIVGAGQRTPAVDSAGLDVRSAFGPWFVWFVGGRAHSNRMLLGRRAAAEHGAQCRGRVGKSANPVTTSAQNAIQSDRGKRNGT
jgi:hypothetical protein